MHTSRRMRAQHRRPSMTTSCKTEALATHRKLSRPAAPSVSFFLAYNASRFFFNSTCNLRLLKFAHALQADKAWSRGAEGKITKTVWFGSRQ